MKYRYKYTGTETKNLPKYGITVSLNGEIVETDKEINHPEFEAINEGNQQPEEDKTEVKTKTKK